VRGDVSVDSETLLVTDFVNLKIKSTQSFRCTHRDMMYILLFIWVSDRTCINFYVYTIFQKKYTYFVVVALAGFIIVRCSSTKNLHGIKDNK
jgi:hypothetical protein